MSTTTPLVGGKPGLSIGQLIDHHARTTPDAIYLSDPATGEEVTYAKLQRACRSFSAQLNKQGILPGDRVAYALNNSAHCVCTILGTLYAGAVITAVNLVSGPSTISHVLHHSLASLVVVDDETRGMIGDLLAESPVEIPVIEVSDALFDNDTDCSATTDVNADGLLMYTSGTTGIPKGVVHTHRSILAGGNNTALAHQLTARDRGLCVLPLYHINGFCVSMIGALVSGGGMVLPKRFSVSTFWSTVVDQKCTWFSIVPTQVSYLLHEETAKPPTPNLRFGRSASAPLSPEVQQAFETRFEVPIIETMGLTETAAQILANPMTEQRKIGSPGIAFGNEVIIADTMFKERPRGEEGELLVRGSNVMRHYRGNEKATSASLTPKGWLRTGDLGRMDDDGYVFITGRIKELIIKGGENIAPREIDDALYSHPDVVEAAAFARFCENYGQKVEAGVKLKDGSILTPKELIELCQGIVGTFKAPEKIHIFPELPKGPSGKIQRLKLVELTE